MPIKILLVEDDLKHSSAAMELIGERYLFENPIYRVRGLPYAIRGIQTAVKKRDEGGGPRFGVLTDLYFPAEEWGDEDSPHGDLAPLGLLVMAECQRLGVPCVIVTAGYHHGRKYNQVCLACRAMGWPEMVDSTTHEHDDADEKNWEEGLKRLDELAAKMCGAG